jgi:hypothetical protein
MAAAAGMRQPSPWAAGVLVPDCCPSFREHSAVALLLAQENQACWLVPSVTHRAAGATGPDYTGVWFTWHSRVKVVGRVAVGRVEL